MSNTAQYLGIDLGTTNSAAAVFDGEQLTLVRTTQGGSLTPSVVRLDARGGITVGARARRFLESDPVNTRSEFKRLMGSGQKLEFPAAKATRTPEQLSAEVLKSLRADVQEQFGFVPERAVISVPALFEVPQANATSEAARLAGFERVELIQEPVASALAAGWTAESADGSWLVYDLGGGTFDASLLETRDGLLRVVGHDGDNFLGGRDFDWAVVDWVLEELARTQNVRLSRADPKLAVPMRKLKLAVEDAKIELTRAKETVLAIPGLFEVDGGPIDIDLVLERATLERLCAPLVDRSIEVCRRLLASAGLEPSQLAKVLLVGGPTVMPMLRERVKEQLGAPFGEGLDPMTLVAQGAAVYAGTAGLDARPKKVEAAPGKKVWLHYPAMSSDITPHVVGRVVEGPGVAPDFVRVKRQDGGFESPEEAVDAEGSFVLTVELAPRRSNVFALEGRTRDGKPAPLQPATFTIVQGLTISDPPLSRTIGVANANDRVIVYFERGAPLPSRRTFHLETVTGVARGSAETALKIPIVQGEYGEAHLCRLIGTLEISGKEVNATLPSGSQIELTLELDRGGQLAAKAFVPALSQVFEHVARLQIANASPEELLASAKAMKTRVEAARKVALETDGFEAAIALNELGRRFAELERDIDAAKGGDADAGQKAHRALLDIDAKLESIEEQKRWPELDERAMRDVTWAASMVSKYGTPAESRLLQEATDAVERARRAKLPAELERQLRSVNKLGNAAYFRAPDAWAEQFQYAASRVNEMTDQRKAQALIKDGRAALQAGNRDVLRDTTHALWNLLPAKEQDRRLAFDSGVR